MLGHFLKKTYFYQLNKSSTDLTNVRDFGQERNQSPDQIQEVQTKDLFEAVRG